MRSAFLIGAAALSLCGCGDSGGEDFTVTVKRPPAAVLAPFSTVDLAQAQALFSGLRVHRTRPGDGEVLYTVPGSDGETSTIHLRFEAAQGGKATEVHATVEVPAVKAVIDGKPKVFSEAKVETALKDLLNGARGDLEMGSAAEGARDKLAALLTAIAIATNKRFLAQVIELKNDPEALRQALAVFGSDETSNDPALQEPDRPMDDPDLAGARVDAERYHADHQQAEALEDATRAEDDASPAEAEPVEE